MTTSTQPPAPQFPRRAVSSLGAPDLSFEALCSMAEGFGLQGVELRVLCGRLDLPGYFLETYGSPEAFGRAAANRPVSVAMLGSSFKLREHGESDRDQLRAFVPWAEAAGVPWIRIFDGKGAWTPEAKRQAATFLTHWEEECLRNGWRSRLLIETHDSILTGDAMRGLADASPQALFLWDSHHTWKLGGEDPETTMDTAGDLVRHIHVKDSRPDSYSDRGYSYVPPGTGNFPMAELHQAVSGRFSDFISLEWERQWHPSLAPLPEALSSARDTGWW